jgi:5-methyltetrahydrofolate--homocysteine methyltransferase
MIPFLDRVKSGEVIIADGAMGTMLAECDIDISWCLEIVNLNKPEILENIARQYFEAGAEIVQTATFGASPVKLSMYSMENKTEEIIKNAVEAVKKVVDDKAYVSGSCGPSGQMLKPYGELDERQMYESFLRQMNAFVDYGVDIICVETMTDLAEAVLAVKAAKKVAPEIPVMATMTFDPTPRGYHTIMGVSVEAACNGLEEVGADIVGSNCGNGIERMVEIAAEFKKNTKLPVIIQSNAGLPEVIGGKPVYTESPEFFARKARKMIDIGVSVIGGCCGTTPEHIRAIRSIRDRK